LRLLARAIQDFLPFLICILLPQYCAAEVPSQGGFEMPLHSQQKIKGDGFVLDAVPRAEGLHRRRFPVLPNWQEHFVAEYAPVDLETLRLTFRLNLRQSAVQEFGFPRVREAILGTAVDEGLREVRRITNIERDQSVLGYALGSGLLPPLVDQELVQGVEQKGAEPAFFRVGPFQEAAIENDLMKELLSEVLGLLVRMAFAPQVTVDRLPISFQEQSDNRLVLILVMTHALKQGPVSREEGFLRSPHICLVVVLDHAATPTLGPSFAIHRLHIIIPCRCDRVPARNSQRPYGKEMNVAAKRMAFLRISWWEHRSLIDVIIAAASP